MKGHHEIFYKNNQKYYNDLEKTNLPKQQKGWLNFLIVLYLFNTLLVF